MDTTDDILVVEEEMEKQTENKEASGGSSYSLTEDEDDGEGESGKEKESTEEEQLGEQVEDLAKEEKKSGGEGEFESEGNEDEKESDSEGTEPESEEENTSGESEGSMAIGNTTMASLEEVLGEERGEETRPSSNLFVGDEEFDSDKDDLSLSEVGKRGRKVPGRSTKLVLQVRKEVAPPARTPLTRRK
ncbi:uncharacterized protein [Nicotiana tomentosiformis]|uniref:uncharacterized protein n=1 Tax=Nicotiana tomentosiformis TaxID=4098 RepID=UPI00051B1D9C|nr:spore wall protein 2-like [Nicotiana tomentosiformis]